MYNDNSNHYNQQWNQNQNQNQYNSYDQQNQLQGRTPTINQQPTIGGSFMTGSQDNYNQYNNSSNQYDNRQSFGQTNYQNPFLDTQNMQATQSQNNQNQFQQPSGPSYEQVMLQFAGIINSARVGSLNHFFEPFDCFRGRQLDAWELQIIFNCHEDQAQIIVKQIGGRDNKVPFDTFFDTLANRYCQSMRIEQMSSNSVYADKLRNIQIQMGILENIANSLLQASSNHTYKQAFESKTMRANQSSIDVQELQQMLSSITRIETRELDELARYLRIDGAMINKIQFIQGFKQVVREESFNPSSVSFNNDPRRSLSPNPSQDVLSSQGNSKDPIQQYFGYINGYLQAQKLTIQLLLRKIGGDPNASHINRQQLVEMGNSSQAKILTGDQMNQLFQQFEDKYQKGFISLNTLSRQIQDAKPILPAQSLVLQSMTELQIPKDPRLVQIKSYLLKQSQKIDQVFTLTSNLKDGTSKGIDKTEFLQFLTSKVGCSKDDAEALSKSYESVADGGKINLTKLKNDITEPDQPGVMNQEKAQKLLNQVFDQMKKYLALQGGNIVQKFAENDQQSDGILTQNEVRFTLNRFGFEKVDQDMLDAVFFTFDKTNSGFLSYIDLCKRFYDYANEKKVKDESDWTFQIFEPIRKYLKTNRSTLAAQFAGDMSGAMQKKDILIESYGFFERLKFMGIQTDASKQQRLLLKLDPNNNHKIDFLVLSDKVGYDIPSDLTAPPVQQQQMMNQQIQNNPQMGRSDINVGRGTNILRDFKKQFYRGFIRNLKVRGYTVNVVEQTLGSQDVQNLQFLPLTTFTNQIMGLCQGSELMGRRDQIEGIGKEYDLSNSNQIQYIGFLDKLKQEFEKMSLLENFYTSMKEALDFRATNNLYEILQMYDSGRNKKFDKDEMDKVFRSRNISIGEIEQRYLFDEYDPKGTGMIDYYDLEKDYQNFIEWFQQHRPQMRFTTTFNLPTILRMIKSYSDMTGKGLREIFKKTRIGDSDSISKFDFARIMTEILENKIDPASIDKLSQELDVGNNQVSFTELMKRFNEQFNIRDDPFEQKFNETFIQQIYWHIAEVIVIKKDKFNIEQHFEQPSSMKAQFLRDLEKPPLLCHNIFEKANLDRLANAYTRGNYVDTNAFVREINDRTAKIKIRNQTFISLKKQLQFRGSTIEEIFKSIRGLGKFGEMNLSPQEFYSVFISIEFKIEFKQLQMLLDTFQQDHEGKVSYVEFIKKYEEIQSSQIGPQARKFFTTTQEIVENIAKVIQTRKLTSFGSLLAGHDLDLNGKIPRDAFYRTIDSLKSGLGEGDIQDLIKSYDPLNQNEIDIKQFANDLNRNIQDFHCQVNLTSLVSQTVGERIVEPSTPSPRNKGKDEIKISPAHQAILYDIVCGLLIRSREVQNWFSEFARQTQGLINPNEFLQGVDNLDVQGDIKDKKSLYDLMILYQEKILGYKQANLLMEHLVKFIQRECSMNKDVVIQRILYEAAVELTKTKVPVRDLFEQFDKENTGYVFRNEFSVNILENYLRIQTILTQNKVNLLVMKYDPNQTFRIRYFDFIGDLKQQEQDHPREVKIYLSASDIEQAKVDDLNLNAINNEYQRAQQQIVEPDLEANSKKNTVVVENQIQRQIKVQIPAIQFEDIMLSTYKRGQAVEVYFKQFGKLQNGFYALDKEKFFEALTKLSLKWADKQKVSEMFDAIDNAAHNQYLRYISSDELGIVVLLHAGLNIQDYQAKTVEAIYKELKAQNLLSKLRDILNYFNTRRDNTCTQQELKQTILVRFDMKRSISESDLDILTHRYKTVKDASRLDFTKFLKDIELVAKGISPVMIWATEFAEDLYKALTVNDYQNQSQFFSKFTKLQNILLIDEFRRAMDEIQLTLYHDEQVQKDFFNHVDMQNTKSGTTGQASKISISQLISTIEKLCQRNLNQLIQEILEKLYGESKKLNITVSVFHIFNEYDQGKTGFISFQDFKYGLDNKLNTKGFKYLDIQFLAKKYMTDKNRPQMVQYEKFFADYEKIEKLGLRAGQDSLKQPAQHQQQVQGETKPLELPPDVKKLYSDMSGYVQKQGLVDPLVQELVRRDINKFGFLKDQDIKESIAQCKMKLSTNQMTTLLHVLPCDQTTGTYSYILMIELLFGKPKSQEIVSKYGVKSLQQQSTVAIKSTQQQVNLSMRPRFKDLIELNLQALTAIAHSISKASWQLKENDFYTIFKRASIVLQSQDLELLQHTFRQLSNQQSLTVDFNNFIKHFNITDRVSVLLGDLQKDAINNKVLVKDKIKAPEITYIEFKDFIIQNKLGTTHLQDEQSLLRFFTILADGHEKVETSQLDRFLKVFEEPKEEPLPYIVNELIYYIVNANIDLFKVVNPNAAKLTKEQFDTVLNQIKFKPTNAKDMPSLYKYLAFDGDAFNISFQKLLEQIRKISPNYGQLIQQKSNVSAAQDGKQGTQGTNQKGDAVRNVKAAQIKMSEFTPKIKGIIQKINAHLKKNGISVGNLYKTIDANKNGLVERDEFLTYFLQTMPIQGLAQGEYEILFETLDSNKDGYLSVNEFCLYLEGAIMTQEQKMKAFDQDLEKDLKAEIDRLFNFFDKNGDGKISVEEVLQAMKSVNPTTTLKEAQEIVKQADKNNNGIIEKQEFYALLLPKLKEELLSTENNLEDLRRIFKEADSDSSGYLSIQEFQQALLKQGVELDEKQLNELIFEIDENESTCIDIDEFIAFLSIADQLKFKNPSSRSTLVNIRRARKLHPIDFYNCFKNLPQFFNSSFTQDRMEKKNLNTPSQGLYPEFDTKSMQYKDLNKMNDVNKMVTKKFIEMWGPSLACEIQLEEANDIPLPKKEEFDWTKITHREVRAVLFDFSTKEFLSNTFILQANWKADLETKWLFNLNQSHQAAKNFYLKTDLLNRTGQIEQTRDIHLVFEFIINVKANNMDQQISCVWGSISALSLDKASKQKITLKGGSPFGEVDINQQEVYQSKKGFQFLKKVMNTTTESHLIINVKPQAKFQENTLYALSLLPSTVIVPKRLLTFGAAFRYYCFKKLTKAQQQMILSQGNFVIAQFRKIYDNPDVLYLLGECWDIEVNLTQQQINYDLLLQKVEDFMTKLYSIIYTPSFQFNHVYPTRSSPLESDIFLKREIMIKQALLTNKSKIPKAKAEAASSNQLDFFEDYKPFNIQEMEVVIGGIDTMEQKQDDLLKMYQQLGLTA